MSNNKPTETEPGEASTYSRNNFLDERLRFRGQDFIEFEPIQRRARVLHSLLIFLFIPLATAVVVIWFYTPKQSRNLYLLLVEGCILLNLLSLVQLRFGFLHMASRTLVFMTMLAPWGAAVVDPAIIGGDVVPLLYITVAVILSSLLLPVMETAMVAAGQFLILVVVLFTTGLAEKVNTPSLLILVVVINAVSILINYLRDQELEKLLDQTRRIERSRKQLHRQAILDPLTGLYNRRYFETLLDDELARAGKEGATIGLLMIDIDHFKGINDTFGHAVGDLVLQEIARLLSTNIRQTDYLIRHGGDELVVIMPGAMLEVVGRRAEQFRKNVEGMKVAVEGQVLTDLTLSIGAAAFPIHGETKEALVRAADQALIQAKEAGRNKVVVAPIRGS